jgi:hypothetical protein
MRTSERGWGLVAGAILWLGPALSAPALLGAQAAAPSVRGTVVDDATGAPLPRVTVSVDGVPQQLLTDASGRFAFAALPRGTAVVRARRLGYAPADQAVRIRPGAVAEVVLRLVAAENRLSAVRTVAPLTEREQFEQGTAAGSFPLEGGVLAALPAVGEPDALRAAQLFPGVVARHDFTAGLNVRGAEQDQLLVRLDGIPLYQPFHLGGVVGAFMEATVGSLQLTTGAPSAAVGGRLGAQLEVTSTEEARPGVHGELQGSLLAGSMVLGGANGAGTRSWQLALRRTYADRIARAVADRDLPYAFTDAHWHARQALPGGGELSMTAYHGRDRLREDFAQRRDTLGTDGAYALDWGNDAAGLTWRQPLGRALLEHRVQVTRFVSRQDEGAGARSQRNDVREWRLTGAVRLPRGAHALAAGWEAVQHDLLYRDALPQLAAVREWTVQRPRSGALFLEDQWQAGRLQLRAGVRAEALSGAGWMGVSPRLAATWRLADSTAVTVTGGRTAQWVHALREEEDALRLFDRWVLSDATRPVTRATHAAVGVERWVARHRFVRVEAFTVAQDPLLERHPRDDLDVVGDEVRAITGRAHGVELLVRQVATGPRTGWIAYSVVRATRALGGDRWAPAQDRRHTLNAVGTWRLANGTVLGARLGVGSGVPVTGVEAQLVRRLADPVQGRWDRGVTDRDVQAVAGARHALRLPPMVRVDLSVQRTFVRARTQLTPVLGLVNATNRRNVFAYRYDFRAVPATRTSLSQLPLLPTLGLTVAW